MDTSLLVMTGIYYSICSYFIMLGIFIFARNEMRALHYSNHRKYTKLRIVVVVLALFAFSPLTLPWVLYENMRT